MPTRLLLFILLLLSPLLHAADNCIQGEGRFAEDWIHAMRDGKPRTPVGQDAARIVTNLEAWLRVNLRLAQLSGFAARLMICDVPGINAYVTRRGEPIRIHSGAIDALGSDEELIAVVLSHEYSHLVLDHASQRQAAAVAIGTRAGQTYRNAMRRTWSQGAALDAARREFLINFMAFNRDQELLADDHGIALLSKSGYKPDAFSRLGMLILSRQGDGGSNAFASHPGFTERLIKSDDRVADESFDQSTARIVQDAGLPAAEPLLRQWLAKMPESGNALYYRALLLRERRPAAALETMEEAFVASKPTLKQKDEDIRNAWVWLCANLYRQGYAVESANCAASFFKGDRQLWQAYQQQAFPGGLWVGGGDGLPPDPNLSFVRTGDGRRLITNDGTVAREHGAETARPTPNWKPVRFRGACGGIGQTPCKTARNAAAPDAGRSGNDESELRAACRPPYCSSRY